MNAPGEPKGIRVLLVEDEPTAAGLFRSILAAEMPEAFELDLAASLASGLELAASAEHDVIVLDLMLPDSRGLDTLEAVLAAAPHVPVVVLSVLEDQKLAMRAVELGAQDYLIKGEGSSRIVVRSLQYAIERQRTLESLRDATHLDDLTGLYNRRGFLAYAAQQLEVARRVKSGAGVMLADIDGLGAINSGHGEAEGDRVLRAVAAILAGTFRGSDVVARFGDDEFAVLSLQERRRGLDAAAERVRQNLAADNEGHDRPYDFSVTLGLHWSDEPKASELESLIGAADNDLYEEKRRRRSSSS